MEVGPAKRKASEIIAGGDPNIAGFLRENKAIRDEAAKLKREVEKLKREVAKLKREVAQPKLEIAQPKL